MKNFERSLMYIITLIVIVLSWIGLESILDGQIIAQKSDSIVALITAYFISDWFYYRYIYKS